MKEGERSSITGFKVVVSNQKDEKLKHIYLSITDKKDTDLRK